MQTKLIKLQTELTHLQKQPSLDREVITNSKLNSEQGSTVSWQGNCLTQCKKTSNDPTFTSPVDRGSDPSIIVGPQENKGPQRGPNRLKGPQRFAACENAEKKEKEEGKETDQIK